MHKPSTAHPARQQRGAALLLALIIMALVTAVVGAMTWHQSRAVEVEGAERARSQAVWILHGALDWARMILREDLRDNRRRAKPYDGLDEPWATPLAETRLSTFLAADKNNNSDAGPEAYVSGTIEDAQSRYNIGNLLDDAGKPLPEQVRALQRLCGMAGLPADAAERMALALTASVVTSATTAGNTAAAAAPDANAVLAPQRLADLAWAGLEPRALATLERWVDLLPARTPVNVNTAPREALVAALDGVDLATAQQLVTARKRKPIDSMEQLKSLLPEGTRIDPLRVSLTSAYFWATIRMRLEGHVVQERSLLLRADDRVDVIKRDKRNIAKASP